MRTALLLLLTVLSVALVGAQPDSRASKNAPYGLPEVDCPSCELIVRDRYVLLHDPTLQTARWVSYVLAPEDIGSGPDRTDDFREDPMLTGERGELDDYRNSGFDRGHLCPAADAKKSAEDMSSTFYLSNMIPQTASLNRGQWARLEDQVRGWVSPAGKLLVVTGPAFQPGKERREIGDGVDVPTHCWKVVVRPGASYAETRAIAFILPNTQDVPDFRQATVTVDAVEMATGIDLIADMPDEFEDRIEARVDAAVWFASPSGVAAIATPYPTLAPTPWPGGPAPLYQRTPTGTAGGSTAARAPTTSEPTVYVTKSGQKYHLTGCQYMHSSSIPMTLSAAQQRYSPCSRCNPP